jgi:Tol biopolymer transport system component
MRWAPVILSSAVLLAVAVAVQVSAADGPAWPTQRDPGSSTAEDRIDQFSQAFDNLREHLQNLQRDVHQKKAPGMAEGLLRRWDEGFRGIYRMNPDGTNVEFLTAAPGMIASVDPQISNDGTLVVFCANPQLDAVTDAKVYVAAIGGPFKGNVREYGYGNTPAWSPDNRQIAYMINDSNPIGAQGGLWIMDADGTNRRWVAQAWFPRWSSDGKTILCHGLFDQGPSLALVDVATGSMRNLLTSNGWTLQQYGGNWSPDGKQVVFIGSFGGKDRLATIDASGDDKSIRILYTNDEASHSLGGPPDGKQIVFCIQESPSGPRRWWKTYLYSLALDSVDPPALVEKKRVGSINRNMAFSPDGSKLLFSSER